MALAVLRLIGEELRKERTAKIITQLPVEVATFLFNEKREWLRTLEDKSEADLIIVPNPHIQTPEYSIKRVRDDETELPENRQTSYLIPAAPEMAEPGSTREQRPAAEAAAVAPILPSTPAPVTLGAAPPAPPEAPAETRPAKGLWARLRGLFGTEAEQQAQPQPAASPEPQPKPPARSAHRRGERSRDGRRDQGRQGRRSEGARRSQGEPRGAEGRDRERPERHPRDRDRDRDRERDTSHRPPETPVGGATGPGESATAAGGERPQSERGERRGRRRGRRGGRRGGSREHAPGAARPSGMGLEQSEGQAQPSGERREFVTESRPQRERPEQRDAFPAQPASPAPASIPMPPPAAAPTPPPAPARQDEHAGPRHEEPKQSAVHFEPTSAPAAGAGHDTKPHVVWSSAPPEWVPGPHGPEE